MSECPSTLQIDAGLQARLIAAARDIRVHAYAPYSRFLVGAALLDERGVIHVGCNIENAAYPLTQCAEASAIAALIASGARRIMAVAVVGNGTGPCPPCGGCRQRLREFARDDVNIIMAGAEGGRHEMQLGALLPASFGPEFLTENGA